MQSQQSKVESIAPEERAANPDFEAQALPWLDDVYRFALSLTRDEADAEDIVQDTYLRAFKSWHTFMPGTDCRRWLFTICRNVFLRSLERQKPVLDLDEAEREAAAAPRARATAAAALEELLGVLDLGPALSAALSKVPEPFRTTILLVDVEDQSYESAAQMLGVPIGTVRSRLFRARRVLQELLAPYAHDAGFGRLAPSV